MIAARLKTLSGESCYLFNRETGARAERFARGSRSKPRGEIGIRAKGVGENLLVTRLKT